MEDYHECMDEIELRKIDISSIMDLYLEMMLNYVNKHEASDVIKMLEK